MKCKGVKARLHINKLTGKKSLVLDHCPHETEIGQKFCSIHKVSHKHPLFQAFNTLTK